MKWKDCRVNIQILMRNHWTVVRTLILDLHLILISLHILYTNLDSEEATHSDMSEEVKKSSEKLSEDTHDESTEKGSTSETADEKGNQQNSSSEGM